MRNRKFSSKSSAVLALFIITTSFILLPNIASATAPKKATGFIYPVLGDGITDPKQNTVDPRPGTASHPDCSTADGSTNETKWLTSGNDFAKVYTETGDCPFTACGEPCVHPGEDWNLCPFSAGKIEGGIPVYAVADGEIVNEGTLPGSRGYYLTVKHVLPSPENLSDYTITPTTGTFDTFYAAYLHINETNYLDAQTTTYNVEKGDQLGTISSCCGHLHFEMRTVAGSGAGRCGTELSQWCGYCSDLDDLTDSSYFEPDKFIRAHIEGTESTDGCQFYPDVWPGKWYFIPVMRLSCLGIIQGYPDGYFRPGNTVNRAEMVKMIVEASGAQCEDGCNRDMPYWDVTNESEWYYPYIKLAYNNDWLPDESECDFLPCVPPAFNPGFPASRGWIAHVLIGALNWENGAYRLISPFDDLANGDEGYRDVARTYQLNIFNGYEDKECDGSNAPGEVNFCYSNLINRAEAAAVIERAFVREGSYQ